MHSGTAQSRQAIGSSPVSAVDVAVTDTQFKHDETPESIAACTYPSSANSHSY
jgi:hypothetical protein